MLELRERDLDLKEYPIVGDKEYCVSTVALGIDYGFNENEHLWYETMIFAAKDNKIFDWADLYCDRYETREQAIEGHDKIIDLLMKNELELY